MKSLAWQIGPWNIPFQIGHDCADAVAAALAAMDGDRLFLIADSTMWEMHRRRYEPALERLPHLHSIPWSCAESGKSLAGVEALTQRLLRGGVSRRSILIAAGGGVVGNLTGLTAALLFRGIRLIHLPTTLLAMHDSVTSLKQGANCNGIKNILGQFHAPTAIFVDTDFLRTLPPAHLRAGTTELVKDALILGGGRADELAAELRREKSPQSWAALIELGIQAKAALMHDDPHERGAALALEYGHTIGHAIELAYCGQLNHGDSVAWGMRCAGWIAGDLGYMSETAQARHEQWISLLGELPQPSRAVAMDEIRRRIAGDNKRGYLPVESNEVAMVLLREPGVVVNAEKSVPLVAVPQAAMDRALDRLSESWRAAAKK